VTLIPWRNLREIFGVLRRREMLGLLVGLGLPRRRHPGPAVRRVDDAAGGTGHARRQDGLAHPADRDPARAETAVPVSWPSPSTVPSSEPAELQRATQALADALGAAIRVAPEQWYNFKPLWPDTEAEAADLERRAHAMQAGRPDPGPGHPASDASAAVAERVEAAS
jgi:hypothetical protein